MNTSALNPEHADNLASITLMQSQGFRGMDASLRISLFEYNLAWLELPTNETLFVYSIGHHGRFDRCKLRNDLDARKEWNWVEWPEILAYTGLTEKDFFARPLQCVVYDLMNYYGYENVFGTSYWEGITIQKS